MIHTLQEFHRYALSRLAWPLSALFGLVTVLVWQLAVDSIWKTILGPLTSAVVVGGSILLLEKLIRKHLWRIVYPEFDFEGTWEGGSTYNHQEIPRDSNSTAFTAFTKEHSIRFVQDCLKVAIEYDQTDAFHGWNSTIATLVIENGKVGLRYAYEVNYNQGANRDPRLPESSKGLEEVFVVNHKEGLKPSRISGTFVHTADGPRPRYSGQVNFSRTLEKREQNIAVRLTCSVLVFLIVLYLKPPAR